MQIQIDEELSTAASAVSPSLYQAEGNLSLPLADPRWFYPDRSDSLPSFFKRAKTEDASEQSQSFEA